MDVGANGIVSWIASSTTSSLSTYEPIFVLVGGLMLAILIIAALTAAFNIGGGQVDGMDLDDTMEI